VTAVLDAQALNKSFGGIKATDNVSLSVPAGELHAVIGPNGAGKTTLITQLCGTQAPDSGRTLFKCRDVTGLPAHKRAQLGMTRSFQITSLILEMSVLDNVALAVQAQQGSSFRFIRPARKISAIQDRALQVLERVGLADKAHMQTRALSQGEHRPIEIAIALAPEADLMLLCEPMAGLGPVETRQMGAG